MKAILVSVLLLASPGSSTMASMSGSIRAQEQAATRDVVLAVSGMT